MAKTGAAGWLLLVALGMAAVPAPTRAQAASASAASAASAPPARAWISVPRVSGRLMARDIGLVINTADPYSVQVGEFYLRERGLTPEQVLRVELPVRSALSEAEFRQLKTQIDGHFGAATQALALAWTTPYAVGCNSITGALALGFDGGFCAQSCAPSKRSSYFNSASSRPFDELKMRPSMLLASRSVEQAKAMIKRGVASDHTLGLRGALPVNVYYVKTSDHVRSVRSVLFPPAGRVGVIGIDVHLENTDALQNVDQVLLYLTGLTHVSKLDTIRWVPGALADHLTSTGGVLEGGAQMSVLDWLASGATASYGTVSEPCSHLQKFPHPQVLLLHYAQGETAIEAYWKSVAWPLQGVFVGEPLAAPFAKATAVKAP